MTALLLMHWLAGVIVLAEALNKLERTFPPTREMTMCQRLIESLKALAWALLALGAGGAVASPALMAMGMHGGDVEFMRLERPTLAETAVLLGFALLIVKTRVKEG